LELDHELNFFANAKYVFEFVAYIQWCEKDLDVLYWNILLTKKNKFHTREKLTTTDLGQ